MSEYELPAVVPIWVNEERFAEQVVLVVNLYILYEVTPAPTLSGASHDTVSFQFEVAFMEISDTSTFRGIPGAEPE